MLKVEYIKSGKIVIYLFNKKYKIDFRNENSVKKHLKDIFFKIKDYYNIKIEGYYEVDVYINEYYGIILELKKQNFDYYDYLENEIEMKIKIHREKYLYMIENYNVNMNKYDIFKLDNNLYLCPKEKLSQIEMAKLVENAKLIYDSSDIIKKVIKIDYKFT